MSKDTEIDRIIQRVVGEQIQNDMALISRTFNTLIEKYAFLFDGDTLETQRVLRDASFPDGESIVLKATGNENEKVYFKMETLIDRIPESVKSEMYSKLLDRFVQTVSIDDIKKDNQEGQ